MPGRLLMIAFTLAYGAFLFAGYALQVTAASITTIWPADGLLFAVLMCFRRRDWLPIVVIAFAMDVIVNKLTPGIFRLDSALWYAGAHVFGGAVGAALAQRWVRNLHSQQQAMKFYVVGAISCALSTTVSAVLFVSRHSEASPAGEWLRWWAGSVLGVVAFAPFAIMWIAHWRRPETDSALSSGKQYAALNALLLVVTAKIFGAAPVDLDFDSGFQFMIFPILVAIALRHPPRWAMASSAVAVVLAAALTNHGLGPFASSANPTTAALSLQVFLALAAAMTFMTAIAADESRGLLAALTSSNSRYRREARLLRAEVKQREVLEQQHAGAERRNTQLASLVRHSREFIGIATLDGQGEYINEAGRTLIGMQRDESVSRLSVSDFVHADERERFTAEIMPALRESGHWSGELAFRRLTDESAIPMLVEAFRIDDDDGRPLWLATVGLDLTDRKAAEAKLQASESRAEQALAELEAVYREAPVGLAFLDRQLIFRKVNAAMAAINGLPIEQHIGRTFAEILPAPLADRLRSLYQGVLDTGVPIRDLELTARSPADPERDRAYLVNYVPVGCAGKEIGVSAVVTDITNRKQSENALRASETRLRTIIDTEPECVKVVDRSGRLLEMNAAGLAMIEAGSVEEARTYGLINFICPEHRMSFGALHQRVLNGERGDLEFEVTGLRGTRRWLHTAAAPLWDDALAEPVLLGITRDVTDRKRLVASLAKEAARNRLFLRTASDGVHIQNSAGRLIEVSESFCRMLGYEREELIGQDASFWDARLADEELRAAFAGLKKGSVTTFRTVHRRKDGTTFPVEIHADRFEVDGELHVYCSARDITEQGRLERALLEATNNEQHKLGRDVHDGVGQELTGISLLAAAAASTLRRAGRPEAVEVEKLASLTRQAIASCRAIAHGLSPVAFAAGGLVEILKEMVALQRDSFGIDATFEVTGAAPLRLGADALDNLYRIAQEAVANARRHGRAAAIHITLNVRPTTVRLSVLDDGVGFAATPVTSTGMGLKIMQVRAAIIGAQLSIKPASQGGTLVSCECPQPIIGTAPETAG